MPNVNFENLIGIAVVAMVTGASNALGVWLVSRHLINRIEKKNKERQK